MKRKVYLMVSLMLLLVLGCLVACDGNNKPAETTVAETTVTETTAAETMVTETTAVETTAVETTATETTATETTATETTATETTVAETMVTETTADAMTTASEETTEPESLTPEEIQHMEDLAYLESVTYLDFELTGNDDPYYVGRWFEKEINGTTHMVTTTDGSLLYIMVEGATRVDVTFTSIHEHTTPYYAYSIDGQTPERSMIASKKIRLPDTGRHIICILADGLTDGEKKWVNETGMALKSVTTDGRMIGIKPTDPVIFFYGDSITEGIMSLGGTNNSVYSSATNAYPWHTATALGAVPYYIGYSATGLIQTGSFSTCLNAIDYLSQNRTVESSSVATITPDLIVINHGVNDAYENRNSTLNIVTAARQTLSRLQAKYPGVKIIYVVPFLEGDEPNVTAFANRLDQLAASFEDVYVVHTGDWNISYTDGIHPNVEGAGQIGTYLSEAIVSIVGKDFFD